MQLFCRSRDGGFPVDITPEGYILHGPTGPIPFTTKRALLSHITGHPRGRNWSFSRYFEPTEPDPAPLWAYPVESPKKPAPGKSESPRGIDVAKKYQDIKKIFCHGFRPQLLALRGSGVDEEDLLQEVYLGILSRNEKNGKGKFDPTRSSFSHYVHLVARSKTNQIGRKQVRWGKEIPIEENHPEEPSTASEGQEKVLLQDFLNHLEKTGNIKMVEVVQGIGLGLSGRELAAHLGKNLSETKRLLKQIRQAASDWDQVT